MALRRFASGQIGSVTVEFVVFLPVFLILLAVTADACKLYLTQANMWDVARDTARQMAIGQYCTPANAQNYAQTQMLYTNLTYTYSITGGTGYTTNTVIITTPMKQASVFGVLAVWGKFSTGTLAASVVMPSEPGVCT